MPVININVPFELKQEIKKDIFTDILDVIPKIIYGTKQGTKILINENNQYNCCSLNEEHIETCFVFITINMLEGKTSEQKEKIVYELTRIVSIHLNIGEHCIWSIINEVKKEHWAKGGITCG